MHSSGSTLSPRALGAGGKRGFSGGRTTSPFHETRPRLPQRLKQLERRLRKDATLAHDYQSKIDSYLEQGYAWKLSPEEATHSYLEQGYARKLSPEEATHQPVDNYIDSTPTTEEAVALTREVMDVHEGGGFVIRNWVSNSPTVLKSLPSDPRSPRIVNVHSHDLPIEKTPGLRWDPAKDTLGFFCDKKLDPKAQVTERSVLRHTMSVFDPLGLVSCHSIVARMLLQDVWRTGIGWDDELPSPLALRWTDWAAELDQVATVEVHGATHIVDCSHYRHPAASVRRHKRESIRHRCVLESSEPRYSAGSVPSRGEGTRRSTETGLDTPSRTPGRGPGLATMLYRPGAAAYLNSTGRIMDGLQNGATVDTLGRTAVQATGGTPHGRSLGAARWFHQDRTSRPPQRAPSRNHVGRRCLAVISARDVVVNVKTASGRVFRRPAAKMCVLDVQS